MTFFEKHCSRVDNVRALLGQPPLMLIIDPDTVQTGGFQHANVPRAQLLNIYVRANKGDVRRTDRCTPTTGRPRPYSSQSRVRPPRSNYPPTWTRTGSRSAAADLVGSSNQRRYIFKTMYPLLLLTALPANIEQPVCQLTRAEDHLSDTRRLHTATENVLVVRKVIG
jgi:hypothetical protein